MNSDVVKIEEHRWLNQDQQQTSPSPLSRNDSTSIMLTEISNNSNLNSDLNPPPATMVILVLNETNVDELDNESENRFTPMCRICRSNEPIHDLIVPCNCTGSLKYVHQSCLQNWLNISGI